MNQLGDFKINFPRQRHVFHTDALGSVVAMSDESGTDVQNYTYAAFGEIREQAGADMNRITYTAREALGDALGFYYYRNRIMDPATGRFISEDPLGFIDGPNRYLYVGNNPLYWLDPFGLEDSAYDIYKCFGESVGTPIWNDIQRPSASRPESDAVVWSIFNPGKNVAEKTLFLGIKKALKEAWKKIQGEENDEDDGCKE